MRRTLQLALCVLLAWIPTVALACPSCLASTKEDTRNAFIFTTGLLSVLPILLLGLVVWWARKRYVHIDEPAPAALSGIEIAD